MDIGRPYFLTNSKWYYYDDDEGTYKLTEEAPEEATKSYNEYYLLLDEETPKF